MKYIITESRLHNIIFKYLNHIDWKITYYNYPEWGNITRLFEKNESQFPEDAIFEAFQNDCPDGNIVGDVECPEGRVLLVNRTFYDQIMGIFGLNNIETHKILIEWYETYTDETINDRSLGFID